MRGIGMEELSNGHVSVGQSSQNLIPESRPFIFLALIVQMWYWKKTFMRIYGLWNLRFAPSRCDFWLRAYEGKCWVVNDWIVRDVIWFLIYIFFVMILLLRINILIWSFCFYVLLYLNSTSYNHLERYQIF